jgi:hypothetical protein
LHVTSMVHLGIPQCDTRMLRKICIMPSPVLYPGWCHLNFSVATYVEEMETLETFNTSVTYET